MPGSSSGGGTAKPRRDVAPEALDHRVVLEARAPRLLAMLAFNSRFGAPPPLYKPELIEPKKKLTILQHCYKEPWIPIGALTTVSVLCVGFGAFVSGNKKLAQNMMRARVAALMRIAQAIKRGKAAYEADGVYVATRADAKTFAATGRQAEISAALIHSGSTPGNARKNTAISAG